MAVYREAPTCEKCGKQIKGIYLEDINLRADFIGDNFVKWDYEGHECSESRVKLLNLAKSLKIDGLVKALTDPKTNQVCEDIRNCGWILCSTDLPEAKEGYLPVTNGKEQWLGYYSKRAERWILAGDAPFAYNKVVAWTYNHDLSQLQEYLKKNGLFI